MRAMEENWVSAGYTSAEHMAEAAGEGREIISRYVQSTLEKPPEGKTIFLERQVHADLGAFRLIGRVDRVDERPDESWDIIDYKSGRLGVTQEEVAADVAMGCYQLILRRKYPERRITAAVIALRTSASATVSLTDEELNQFEADLIELGTQILSTSWEEHQPIAKALCHSCDFLPLCRKSPEFELASVE